MAVFTLEDRRRLLGENGKKNLGVINIPYGYDVIGKGVFEKCSWLKKVILPPGVKEIQSFAFAWCHNLRKVEFPKTLKKVGSHAFYETAIESIKVPANLKTIENSAFANCEMLESVAFDSVSVIESIKTRAFFGCCSLKEFNAEGEYKFSLPYTVKDLGESAFAFCSNLTYITTHVISCSCFSNCWKIQDIGFTILEGPSNYAFYGCSSLEKISFPKGTAEIGMKTFGNCKGLKKVFIPNTIKKINDGAFKDCESLKEVIFEEGIEEILIHENAFLGCTAKFINYPDNVTIEEEEVYDD